MMLVLFYAFVMTASAFFQVQMNQMNLNLCYNNFSDGLPGTNPTSISGAWRERARSVVKLGGDGSVCTAFKYSADLYATNAHCETSKTKIYFDHECGSNEDLDTCGGNNSKTCDVEFFAYGNPNDRKYDWGLYRLKGYCSHNDGRNWLHIAPDEPTSNLNNQKIVIIHHPAGERKIIHGLTNIDGSPNNGSPSWTSSLNCYVLSATDETGILRTQCKATSGSNQIVMPTAGGSSGAPIFNTAGQVITINNGKYHCERFHGMALANMHNTFYSQYPQSDFTTQGGRRGEEEDASAEQLLRRLAGSAAGATL